MKVNFYGPIANKAVIRRADADIYNIGNGLADSDLQIQKIRIDPNPLSTIGLADSDFGFTTTIYDALDSAP